MSATGPEDPAPHVQVSFGVPDGWRLLPLDAAGRAMAREALVAQGQPPELVALVDGFTGAAAAQSLILWATGRLDVPSAAPASKPPREPARTPARVPASVLVGVRAAGAGPALDEQAQALAATGLTDGPDLSFRDLPLAGPSARLAWTSGPAGGPAAPTITCVQYCLPFPEDGRSALLLLSAAGPAGSGVAAALDELAQSAAFLEGDGTVILPAARRSG